MANLSFNEICFNPLLTTPPKREVVNKSHTLKKKWFSLRVIFVIQTSCCSLRIIISADWAFPNIIGIAFNSLKKWNPFLIFKNKYTILSCMHSLGSNPKTINKYEYTLFIYDYLVDSLVINCLFGTVVGRIFFQCLHRIYTTQC